MRRYLALLGWALETLGQFIPAIGLLVSALEAASPHLTVEVPLASLLPSQEELAANGEFSWAHQPFDDIGPLPLPW